MSEQLQQIDAAISKLADKDFGLYFFTMDTKGNPVAGIANIYEHVKILNELGYKASILHEFDNYKLRGDAEGMGVADWLGEEYAELPHTSIQAQQLNVGPQDIIFVPEVFANVMEQVSQFPCKKVVFCQSHEYALELLGVGRRWSDFGFNDALVTSDRQGNYIRSLFPTIKTHTIPISIPEYFSSNEKPKQPIVTIVSRNQTDTSKIAKQFYLQYPIYQFVTFEELKNSCLAVWVDDLAGFGTFPLEAMECDTPVIGKIPNTIPEWMEKSSQDGVSELNNHGVWTNTTNNIPELIATYLKVWLEDTVPADLVNSMKESKGKYTRDKQVSSIESVYGELVAKRIENLTDTRNKLQEQLDAAQPQVEVKEKED
jgi:glycosyltransferase involved in cell wall biosynthesis